MADEGRSTYNIYAFVPCDTDLCALGTEIYANDAHGCGGKRVSETGVEMWEEVGFLQGCTSRKRVRRDQEGDSSKG